MKVLGITGGVGSGKSVVLSIMEEKLGCKTILSDLVAHDLMEPGAINYNEIVKAFGTGILNEDQTINRQALGAIVFADEEKLNQLNAITHPNVKEEIKNRIAKIKEEGTASAILLEAALLIEAGYEEIYDELWYIYVNKETRYERLYKGRGYSRERTDSIMKNQLSEEEYRAHADVIIDNSYTVEETERQIRKVFR